MGRGISGFGGRGCGMPLAFRADIVRRVRGGERAQDVARDVGVNVKSVYRCLSEAGGMPPRWKDRSPRHLSLLEREEISRGLIEGVSFRVISARLGRHPSTVSREVKANGGREKYRGCRADQRACRLARRPKPTVFECNKRLRQFVEAGLESWWSPQQISASLVVEFPNDQEMRVSHETIYQTLFVQSRGGLRKDLTAQLRSGRTQRRSHHRAAKASGKHADMVMISDRPAEIEDRAVPGHWEGDLVIGRDGDSAFATLVERSSRFTLICALPNGRTTQAVTTAIREQIQTLPAQLIQSITWDQGKELASHKAFTIDTGIAVYFCDPHSPWQRGTNENTNGLLRQWFPKGTDLSVHTQADLDYWAHMLNTRPRQTLGWMTPSHKLAELVATTA